MEFPEFPLELEFLSHFTARYDLEVAAKHLREAEKVKIDTDSVFFRINSKRDSSEAILRIREAIKLVVKDACGVCEEFWSETLDGVFYYGPILKKNDAISLDNFINNSLKCRIADRSYVRY